jgi:hypothetical protein
MSQKPDNDQPQSAAAVTSPPCTTEPAARDVSAGPPAVPVRTDPEAGEMWIPL